MDEEMQKIPVRDAKKALVLLKNFILQNDNVNSEVWDSIKTIEKQLKLSSDFTQIKFDFWFKKE
jgi:hypothetical protein